MTKSVNAAFPIICDFYCARERGFCSDEQKSNYRAAFWQTATDESRWKQHLSEMAETRLTPESAEQEGARLPKLGPGSTERIERALKDARAHVRPRSAGPDDSRVAVQHYFDAIAWEYLCTRSAAEFGELIDAIGEEATRAFDVDKESVADRGRHWLDEARERASNGIVGEKIPVRIDPTQAPIFHELELQFRGAPGSRTDLQAMFADGGQRNICRGRMTPRS